MDATFTRGIRGMVTGVTKNHSRSLIILVMVSLVLRFGVLVLAPEPHLSTNASIAYLGGAHLLVEGNGFRDPSYPLFTPPLYAVVIGGLLSVFGTDQLPIKIVQIFLDVATGVILYMIGRSIFSPSVGIIASMMWAVYPFGIYATLYVGTETMFAFFLVLFLLLLLRGITCGGRLYFCTAGIALGLATLTRGTTQFMPFLLPGLWFLWRGQLRTWVMNCAICLVAFGLVILPWAVRNYMVLDDVIPVATAGGVFLWGASEQLLTIDERERELPGFLSRLRAKGIEGPSGESKPTAKDRYMMRAAIEHYKDQLKEDPIGLMKFFLKKFLRLWYATESGNNHVLVLAMNAPIYVLALWGIMMAWRRNSPFVFFPLYLVGYFVILHVLAFPLFRYLLPVIPFLLIYAALAVSTVADQVRVPEES